MCGAQVLRSPRGEVAREKAVELFEKAVSLHDDEFVGFYRQQLEVCADDALHVDCRQKGVAEKFVEKAEGRPHTWCTPTPCTFLPLGALLIWCTVRGTGGGHGRVGPHARRAGAAALLAARGDAAPAARGQVGGDAR